jgi:fructokinase
VILCCGEALIDMLPMRATDGRVGFAPAVGGSVFNTAIALGRLGADVGFHSKIATDDLGEQLRLSLHDSKVNLDHLKRSSKPTPLAIVHLVDGHASYQFYDEGTAAQDFAADEVLPLPATVDLAFFGGISLLGENSGPYYQRLLTETAQHIPVMMDPNIRPNFINDEAAYRRELDGLFPHVSILKVSDEDLAWIAGLKSVDEKIQEILDLGTDLILITKGGDGVEAVGRHVSASVPAEPVQVVDTVGAGDTFTAGFLSALQVDNLFSTLLTISEDQLRRALSRGAQAAAITVSRDGANPPWREELLS